MVQVKFIKLQYYKFHCIQNFKLSLDRLYSQNYLTIFPSMQTFQPNSIRSLLNKRNSRITKIQKQDNQQKTHQKLLKTSSNFNKTKIKITDPDLESLLEAKLMIKDIDHDIDTIRNWRQHQKQILQQKFRSNKQLSKLSQEQYLRMIERQLKQDELVNAKIIQKIKLEQAKLKKPYNFLDDPNSQAIQWEGALNNQNQLVDSQPYIFDYINEAQNKVQRSKYTNYQRAVDDKHQAFLNDINNMNQIFTKKIGDTQQQKNNEQKIQQKKENNEQKKFDRSLLKKELQDIEDQLRQMQQLMKD